MTIKISTGFRDGLLGATGVKEMMDGGCIRIYSGTEPATADTAIGGGNTLLSTITVGGGGTGVTFEAPAAGVLAKETTETWSGTNAASGTASFFRISALTDTGALSTTEKRIQGSVGTTGADMVIESVSLVSGQTQTISACNISIATS